MPGYLKWPSNPTEARQYANKIFSSVAPRYDTMKWLLSLGQENRWKREAFRRVCSGAGGNWLDLAAGTGDVVDFAVAFGRPSAIFALDLRHEMLLRTVKRHPNLANRCVVADLNELPFKSESVDVISLAYGLRYITNLNAFFADIHRILRPGGLFIAFDLAHPVQPLKAFWYSYLFLTGSVLGLLLHGSLRTYWHLVESLRAYPGQRTVTKLLQEAGFQEVTMQPLVLSTMAVHSCIKIHS
jgi:demethylmenaquinone methyltransferase/2-methoxy-6-polyprenyl-1,4-benzoquinol methylase